MRNIFFATLVISQAFVLLPSQAQTTRESKQPANNPVAITSEVTPNTNTTSLIKPSDASNSSELKKEIAADSNNTEPSVANKPSSRMPIFSKIFNHPAMQQ